jgi:uncharacterized protein
MSPYSINAIIPNATTPADSKPEATTPYTSPTALIPLVHAHIVEYMSHYDCSHDLTHIHRVLALAHTLSRVPCSQTYDPTTITLSALLHDVGDRKYLKAGENAETMIENVLLGFNADPVLATKIQTICSNVSYTNENKNPENVAAVVREFPELAVVQDADRLDAIGAVGIGRVFSFGAVKGSKDYQSGRGMENTMGHFEEKLLKLGAMMKTDAGRAEARKRTERLQLFKGWWDEETGVTECLGSVEKELGIEFGALGSSH